MAARVLWSGFAMVCALSLSACSDSSSGPSAPNSFPPLENDFTDSSSGDTSNSCSNIAANEICVTVEVPRSLAGADAVETRRNLSVVRPTAVEVARLENGVQAETLAVSRRRDTSGSTILTLKNYESVPLNPNLVIVATLSDGTQVRGPLSDVDQDVKINPFSEYLVANVLGRGQLGPDDIAEINGCGELCLRRLIWPNLADTIQDFEITIPSEFNIAEAVELLDSRIDFTGYVSAMVGTMKVDTGTSGANEVSAAGFNTVYFGLELNRSLRTGTSVGQWGTRRSITGLATSNGTTADIYPTLTLASFAAFGLEGNSIAGEFPYQRRTQLYPEPPDYSPIQWQPNSHAVASSFVVAQGKLLRGGRSPYQEVTNESGGRIWGWASNPYFYEGYRTGAEGSTGLMASYLHSGKAIELEVENRKFNRLGTLEDLAVGTLEVDLQQISSPQQGTPLSFTPFSGPYSAVSFSVRLGEEVTPVEARVQVQDLTADVSSGNAVLTEDTSSTFSGGWSLKRESAAGAVQGPEALSDPYTITLSNQKDEYYTGGGFQDAYYGRITATGGNRQGLGAAVENGNLLAYTFNSPEVGQGINIIARHDPEAITNGTYTLQGFALGMTAGANRLEQLNGAALTVGAGNASLTSAPVQVRQTFGAESRVTDPSQAQQTTLNGTSTVGDGRFELTLGNAGGTVLQGYAIEGGDVLVMTLKGPERVGLVLGFRQ